MIADLQQQLGIDASFFPQLVIFLFVSIWLRYVFFLPYLKLIQKRENSSEGLSGGAHKLEEESSLLEQQYKDKFSAMKKQAQQQKEALLQETRKAANELVSSAREQAKSRLEAAREASAKAAEAELQSLRAQVGSVSSLLVERLTKTKVGL